MHLQVATSPEPGQGPDQGRTPQERLLDRTAALRDAGINVEGFAPELDGAHFRWVVRDRDARAAMEALGPWKPVLRPAFTMSVKKEPGSLDRLLGRIARHYRIESVVILTTDPRDGGVLVSVGIDRHMEWDEWRDLGGWDDGEEHPGAEGTEKAS